MDWNDDTRTNLWVFPRGMQRDGAAGPNSVKWTSKYGSLITSAYEAGSADGMNEKGLVANLLYLADADFGKADGKPMLSISAWPQYVLDNFATVAEAVDALRMEPLLPSNNNSRSTPIGRRWAARRSSPAPSAPPTASSALTI